MSKNKPKTINRKKKILQLEFFYRLKKIRKVRTIVAGSQNQ